MANIANLNPCNIEAECACIYAMIKDQKAFDEGLSRLNVDDFYDKRNAAAFKILINIFDKRLDVNEVVIFQEAKTLGFEKLVDKDYLREIQEYTYAISNFSGVVKIIIENSLVRKLFHEFNDIGNKFETNQFESLGDVLNISKKNIDQILDSRNISDFLGPKTLIDDLSKRLEDAHNNYSDREITGLDCGFDGLNGLTLGFQPGNMIILAARPGIGKTSLALNIAQHISESKQGSVGIFSQEMSGNELESRIASFKSGIPLKDLSRGRWTELQVTKIRNALDIMKEGKIYIDETPGIELYDLIAKSKKLYESVDDLKLIIIDHIGLIKNKGMDNKSNISRTQSLGFISRTIKNLARELNIPILVLCQLSRKVDENPGKRPLLSNLRESGELEQDADLVLGMSVLDPNSALAKKTLDYYGKKPYNPGDKKTPDATDEDKLEAQRQALAKELNKTMNESKNNSKDDKGETSFGLMLIEALKNRNGPQNRVILEWDGKLTCFYNLNKDAAENILRYISATGDN